MEKRNVVLLTVIAVATLLTAMVGSTFAYFSITVSRTQKLDPKTTITTAQLNVQYSEGSTISASGIVPGWESSKDITITNNSQVDAYYTVSFLSGVEENEFNYSNGFANLEYKLEGDEGNASTTHHDEITGLVGDYTKMEAESLKAKGDNTLVSGHLAPSEHHKFTLSIQLKNDLESEQPGDENKTFKAKLTAVATTVKPENP